MPPTESLLDEGGWSEWLEEQRKQEQLHKLRQIGISEDLIPESIKAEGLVPPQGNGLVSSVPEEPSELDVFLERVRNFPYDDLDWKRFLLRLGIDLPFVNWPLRRRVDPNIPEVEEWNP